MADKPFKLGLNVYVVKLIKPDEKNGITESDQKDGDIPLFRVVKIPANRPSLSRGEENQTKSKSLAT
jgi:hypothetical protein